MYVYDSYTTYEMYVYDSYRTYETYVYYSYTTYEKVDVSELNIIIII